MTPEEENFREKIVQSILERDFELPMLPHVALKVIRLTSDTGSSMQDLAKVIMTDQTIASRIIRLCNSPVYAAAVEITNINQALVRLGQTEIKNVMLAISLQTKIFKSRLYGPLAKRLWERSVGTAFASRVIAGAVNFDKEEAFLCGLMHNIGKMVSVTIVEEAQRKMGAGFHPTPLIVDEIIEQYGVDVGELTVEKWTMPHRVAMTVHFMNRLDDLENDEKVVPIVALGEALCRRAGIGALEPEEVDLSAQPGRMRLHLAEEACAELHDRFVRVFDAARSEFI